ncbi:MAG: family 10 glycosylhydrolase [Bacteroidaceae bacterium]|nr:family 10 glycosylhydrolase [Bacteroidaceae bacterium]
MKLLRTLLSTALFTATATVPLAAQVSSVSTASIDAACPPKREFRGAWIQAVNGQWQGLGRDKMQAELTRELNALQADGINVILFQCRVEGDALYESALEPWSRYLTGQQGTPPQPYWDPLGWMVEQCHARQMELHAWINPYRAKTKGTQALATTHYAVQHPERCFSYDGLTLFDPGMPENRQFICQVAADIVRRYDVDGLHIDDYFYPYPVAGVPLPDDQSYALYGQGIDRGDWRRENVNLFIRELRDSVRAAKPWVKFGVSPFGIYRNQRSWAQGSATNGTQNYDDLYADVLLWIQEGWIDYNIPQLYWEIGHKAADYETLIRWWSQYAQGRPLIIGQDVDRMAKAGDMVPKLNLQHTLPGIDGSCQWYARAVVDDRGGYGSALRTTYHRTLALQPRMPWLDNKAPRKVRRLKAIWTEDGYMLFWTAPRGKKEMDKARQYAIYCFAPGETINTEDASHLIAITSQTFLPLPYNDGTQKWTYVVTALDRLQNESKAAKKVVKL